MTEDQFLSLFHFDHNILHETGHPDRDAFWNLTPMLIQAHRTKTKADAKVIAKGKRIRKRDEVTQQLLAVLGDGTAVQKDYERYHKLRSRGFDRTRRRKMDGTVVKR